MLKPANRTVIEPNWGDWQLMRLSSIPSDTLDWLRFTGSLTKRVLQACGERKFRVRLLRQEWGSALYSELRMLKLRQRERTQIREVELHCDRRPWVFARTLIPASSLQGAARRLTMLGEKPLGALLFSDPAVSRGVTQIAQLQPQHPLFVAASNNLPKKPKQLWGRRTIFYISGRPILVNEIFLPELPVGQ